MKFFEISYLPKRTIAVVFLIKVAVGTGVWAIYTYYYTGGDIQSYFNDGEKLYHLLLQQPQQFFDLITNKTNVSDLAIWNNQYEFVLYNDARTMSVLNMVVRFFSFGNFHVHTIFFSFLSLLGFTAIYKTFIEFFSDRKKIFFAAVFLIPTVLFWSSAALKESVLFFALGTFLYTTNSGFKTSYNWQKIISILIAITLFLLMKFYVLLALIPGVLVNIWTTKSSNKLLIAKYFLILSTLFVFAFFIGTINEDYDAFKIISERQARAMSEARGGIFLENGQDFVCINFYDNEQLVESKTAGYYSIKKGAHFMKWHNNNLYDTIFVTNEDDVKTYKQLYTVVPTNAILQLKRLKPNVLSFIKQSLSALMNAVFIPFPTNCNNYLQLLSFIESNTLLLLICICVFFFRTAVNHKILLFFLLSFSFILLILIGLTTPSIGALIRYKTPAIPFILMAALLCFDKEKFCSKYPSLEKFID
jgi:hypothetical protein